MHTILDVSNWQESVDFRRVKAAGIDGVWLRKSEGLHLDDQTYWSRHTAALDAGLHVGPYFFAHPEESEPELQADHFCRGLQELAHERSLRPMLDYEIAFGGRAGEEWIRRFNHRVLTNGGVGPVFYSNPWVIEQLKLSRPVGWGLVVSAFGRDDGAEHPYTVPEPWRHAVAHQFSSRCRVAGCTGLVDLSHAPRLEPLLANPREGDTP